MSNETIIRAWKDSTFRASLADAPAHPAGARLVEVDEDQLQNVAGAVGCGWICSISGDCNASGRSCWDIF